MVETAITLEALFGSELGQLTKDFDFAGVCGLSDAIDRMGERSAKAQDLKTPITSVSKLQTSDHRLYLFVQGQALVGMLKVGTKHIYYMVITYNNKQLTVEIAV